MTHHVDFAVEDLPLSREFYVRALAPLGLGLVVNVRREDGREMSGFGKPPDPVFWIRTGTPITEHIHLAFGAPSRWAVDAFHAAALAAGGRDNGKPGLRPWYAENYYAAFVIDPDGHNIEAVCRAPDEATAGSAAARP